MSLTKEQILSADDKTREKIDVPLWGGEVYVQSIGGGDRELFELEFSVAAAKGLPFEKANVRARFLAACLCDQDGRLLFNAEDVEALGVKSNVVLCELFDVAKRVSKFGSDTTDELVGN